MCHAKNRGDSPFNTIFIFFLFSIIKSDTFECDAINKNIHTIYIHKHTTHARIKSENDSGAWQATTPTYPTNDKSLKHRDTTA